MRRNVIRIAAVLSALPASGAVMAHTGSHEVVGLVSGLSHPLSGLDHFTAIVAIGLLAALGSRERAWLPLSAFLVFMALGAAWGMTGIGLAGIETGIATSVLILGLLLAAMARLPAVVGVVLAGLVALLHGGAHGAEIPLAAMPLWYALGFLSSTAVLLLGGAGLGQWLRQRRGEWLMRGAGVAACGLGAWLLLAT